MCARGKGEEGKQAKDPRRTFFLPFLATVAQSSWPPPRWSSHSSLMAVSIFCASFLERSSSSVICVSSVPGGHRSRYLATCRCRHSSPSADASSLQSPARAGRGEVPVGPSCRARRRRPPRSRAAAAPGPCACSTRAWSSWRLSVCLCVCARGRRRRRRRLGVRSPLFPAATGRMAEEDRIAFLGAVCVFGGTLGKNNRGGSEPARRGFTRTNSR
jgi:hypothetical protein